jgi:DNA-binding transcriptional LysR family regulator
MPELRHLRYFVAVADELNFSRAAQRLHMAQPPLSAAIRQLERELGVTLFRRTSREVRLTDAGRAFLDGARRTLAEAERAAHEARRAGAGELGRVRVGYSWSVRFETLPSIGRHLRGSHPGIDLLTQEMWNARMPDALADGTIDMAIALCPEVASELEFEPIRSEVLVALLPAGHALAGEQVLPLESLADEEFVLFPRELAPRLHDAFMAIYRRAGFEPRLRSETFHAGWDIGILDKIAAAALVPASVATALPDGVAAVPLSDPAAAVDTCLVVAAGPRSPAIETCLAAARAVYEPASRLRTTRPPRGVDDPAGPLGPA